MVLINSKDARLPEQLQRAMAAEAEAAREARAKVETIIMMIMIIIIMIIIIIKGDRCRGREESLAGVTRSCWHDLWVSCCSAAQIFTGEMTGKYQTANLKYFLFQTLNSISAEKNSTIIFPFPMDLVGHLFNKNWIFSRIFWRRIEKSEESYFSLLYI